MLYLYFNSKEIYDKVITYPDKAFQTRYKREWALNKFTKRIIEEVDKAAYIAPNVCESEVYGTFSLDKASGGSKCLIYLANKYPGILPIEFLGDNCAELLRDISNEVDCHIWYNWAFKFADNQVAYFPEYDETYTGHRNITIRALELKDDWQPEV